ncbi:putative Zinc metalloproteinase nas-14 [Hypsibius exemplaris]|uniref:Metalloendopeptidase n=1 Tax=Hypsibius exemplaris TaxID=2072580 RepID=A0A9X6RJY0_HYPEX|nr:putative Zinc metalloproteinase nas-14 [Hypsibius exemplaris]
MKDVSSTAANSNDESDASLAPPNGSLFEGDILGRDPQNISVINVKREENGFMDEAYRWPDGVVPYQFSTALSERQRLAVREAMSEMENRTCVKFVQRNTQDFIHIAQMFGHGCSSYVGRQNRGGQLLNLESGCWTKGTIQHELMHALGFFHEHSRVDRDEYVEIVSANIQQGDEDNFRSWDNNTITAFGLPYDFESILHYPSHLFARRNSVSGATVGPTIKLRPKYEGKIFGSQLGLSSTDIRKINLMYKCRQSQLESGDSLKVGQALWSPDGQVKLSMESHGNLVLYRQCDGRAIWSTNMSFQDQTFTPTSVTMQADGNLAMYQPRTRYLVWSTDTRNSQFSGAGLKVLDEGYFCLHKNKECLWTSGGVNLCRLVPAPIFQGAKVILQNNGTLLRGQSLTSFGGTCNITLQQNGDIVIRHFCDEREMWSTKHGIGRAHNLGYQEHASIDKLEMRQDGNLQLHLMNGEKKSLHSSVVDGHDSDLRLSDDCQMCIFRNGSCRWKSYSLSHTPLNCFVRSALGERWTTTNPHKTGRFLVIAQGPSLWRLPVEDRSDTKQLTNISGEDNFAVAVDCVNHHLYWANHKTGIRRSRYDGSDNHLVVTNGVISYGLAVDFVSGNMFWVQNSAILVAKMSQLETGHKTIISHTEIGFFSALAVHPSRGSIYWSHSDTTIETASTDGSNRQVWVTGVCAISMALDYEANDLYWADHNTGNIECISLDGGGKRIVSAQGTAGKYSRGISLSGERVYWTSYSPTYILNSITKSGSTMKQHSLPAGRSGNLLGIVFVPEQCPKCCLPVEVERVKRGTKTGAVLGALGNGAVGGKIGALAGAAVGGLAGHQIHKANKHADQANAQTGQPAFAQEEVRVKRLAEACGDWEEVLCNEISSPMSVRSPTAEEYFSQIKHIYDGLSGDLWKMADLSLNIVSIRSKSPVLRSTEVFPPIPAAFSADKLKMMEHLKGLEYFVTVADVDSVRVWKATYCFTVEDKSFGTACRIAKRWISSQLLHHYFPDEAVELIMAQVTPLGIAASTRSVFLPPASDDWDFLIYLKPIVSARRHEALDPTDDVVAAFQTSTDHLDNSNKKPKPTKAKMLPVLDLSHGNTAKPDNCLLLDFNAVNDYVAALRETFDELAYFFVDPHGGTVVTVVWKTAQFKTVVWDGEEECLTDGRMTEKEEKGKRRTVLKLSPNIAAMVEDFRLLSNGLAC